MGEGGGGCVRWRDGWSGGENEEENGVEILWD